jgi:hypothetical protein
MRTKGGDTASVTRNTSFEVSQFLPVTGDG